MHPCCKDSLTGGNCPAHAAAAPRRRPPPDFGPAAAVCDTFAIFLLVTARLIGARSPPLPFAPPPFLNAPAFPPLFAAACVLPTLMPFLLVGGPEPAPPPPGLFDRSWMSSSKLLPWRDNIETQASVSIARACHGLTLHALQKSKHTHQILLGHVDVCSLIAFFDQQVGQAICVKAGSTATGRVLGSPAESGFSSIGLVYSSFRFSTGKRSL